MSVNEMAGDLWNARVSREAIPPLRERIAALGGDALAAAYAVQRTNTERAVSEGRRMVGSKIGLTSPAVQKQLGVDQPDFGALFADMARVDGVPIPYADVLQPRIEAEVALVLERDLPNKRNTIADIIRATAFAVPALEICGSRIAGWDIRLVDTVADNASAGAFVLGTRPVSLSKLDLAAARMRMTRGDETASEGVGAACLGNPLNAAVWLADTMAGLGAPLKAGDVILTGALGPMVAVNPGDVFTANIEGLGIVRATFGQ
jgi:2-keto-4-pentenoate hydratase